MHPPATMGISLGTLTKNTGMSAGNGIHGENNISVTGNRNQVTFCLPARPASAVKSFSRENSDIVVLRPSEFFKGRGKILTDIDSILTECQSKTSYKDRILVVHGIPGVGKSELMRQFASKYGSKPKYPNIAWINAQSAETIAAGFSHLAAELQVDLGRCSTLEAIVTKVYKHIEEHCGPNSCLIIFDNVTDLGKIRSTLPVTQSIQKPPLIVITANEPSKIYRNLQLQDLTLPEAIEVIQAILGNEVSDKQFVEAKELLEDLAKLVGCHPLAIVISASYLSTGDARNFKEALKKYMKSIRELSADFTELEPDIEGATGYNSTLKALWKLTMDKIRKSRKADSALYLLLVLGYIDPENVEEKELKQLCTWDCPSVDKDDGWSAFFKKEGNEVIYDGIKQLKQLSILIPISSYEKDLQTSRYRIHRLLQRFARGEDVKQIGIRRAFYHCVNYVPPFLYPGCWEYLQTMMDSSIRVDEKFKQICIADVITATDALPGDALSQLISHFENLEGNSDETEAMLQMVRLRNSSNEHSDDAPSTIEIISRVLSIAADWPQAGYGPYLIQNCALKVILNALYTSPECLDGDPWPEDFTKNFKTWAATQIQLHEDQDGNDREYFPIILEPCLFKVYGAISKVLELDDGINSLESFVKCLVDKTYESCKEDDNLEDGYWHVLSGCLRIKGCRKFLQDLMHSIVEQATDTLRSCNTANSDCHDGFLDCLFMLALVPEYVSALCSSPDFLGQFFKQTQIRVMNLVKLHHLESGVRGDFDLKDIYWGIFLLMAYVREPGKMQVFFLPWYLDPTMDLQPLTDFLKRLSDEAASYYKRWASTLDDVLGGFLGGENFFDILKKVAVQESGNKMQQEISKQVKRFLVNIQIDRQEDSAVD